MLAKRPIQVYLDERQDRALREIASRRGASLSGIVRRSVDLWLSQIPEEEDAAWQIIGIASSAADDLGLEHDRHLYATLEAEVGG